MPASSAARRTAIAGLWAPDGAEFVEGAQFRGHDQLDARIAAAYREFVESGKYFVESGKYTVASADDATGQQMPQRVPAPARPWDREPDLDLGHLDRARRGGLYGFHRRHGNSLSW